MSANLGKLIVAKGFKKLPKVQKIALSGHTVQDNYTQLVSITTNKFYFIGSAIWSQCQKQVLE